MKYNKDFDLEGDGETVKADTEQFKKELKDNGFKPTKSLVSKYEKLVEECESNMSLEEIAEAYSSDNPRTHYESIRQLGKELEHQEVMREYEMILSIILYTFYSRMFELCCIC